MLKSRWAPQGEDEAPKAPAEAPAQQEAAAPPASATYDSYNDPSIDAFAQTAGTDDLFFDDDITPISQPVVAQSTLGAEAPEFVPAPEEPAPAAPQAHAPRAPREPRHADRGGRGRGRGRGEGRGRGRGGRRGGPVGDIRLEEAAAAKEAESAKETPAAEPTPDTSANEPPADAPTGPSTPSTASVRGDRTLTGGSKRTRLTEAELSAKLASMRSKNEALASAHARAQADAAAAEAREVVLKQQEAERKKLAAEKQKLERKDRQQMMGERERNRQRKLNAQGGREWDLEKEDGFDGTGEERRRGATRGAHGGISSRGGAHEGGATRDPFADGGDSGSHRGRGGRGRGGGRGGGGGGGRAHDSNTRGKPINSNNNASQLPPTTADFPELPSAPKPASDSPSTSAPKIKEFSFKGIADRKNEDIRKTEPGLGSELERAEPKVRTDEAPQRPGVKKVESFGLEPMKKGQSWADDE